MIKLTTAATLFLLLTGCSTSHKKAYFEEVSSDYIEKKFDPPGKTVTIDTLVKTENHEFYRLALNQRGEDDVYYFLKRRNKVFALKPVDHIDNDVDNEFRTLQVLDDSTIVLYRQFWNEVFGDFWIIKNGKEEELRVDPDVVSNTNRYDLTYDKGRLKAIGSIQVDLDSLELKKLKNKLYELKNGSLQEVADFKNVGNRIDKFKDGVYYFSYPGRHLSDTLHLND